MADAAQSQGSGSVVSAPGKVLVAGGYLVTQRPHPGLVFSVSARLRAAVRPLSRSAAASPDVGADAKVVVESPQFRRRYHFHALVRTTGDGQPYLVLHNTAKSGDNRNEFIEITLAATLTAGMGLLGVDAFKDAMGAGVVITILGDDAFYSAPETPESEPKKTGLGSSAALVSSLVGALLNFLGLLGLGVEKPDLAKMQLAHNLAQYCHYKAQGKIGSGFDVSSAVFGSQIYTRFCPDVLMAVPALRVEVEDSDIASPTIPSDMVAMLNSSLWNSNAEPLRLPRGMHLLLGDISVGAKTPGMVAAVDRWRHTLQVEDSAWSRLSKCNERMMDYFKQLNELSEQRREAYDSTLAQMAALSVDKWQEAVGSDPMVDLLLRLRTTFVEIRKNLKEMGDLSGAAIEPDIQTEACDATMAIPGVMLAGVPGAGGMDALFAITLSTNAQDAVQALWKARGISPLLLDEDHKGLCADTDAEFAALLRRTGP